MLATNDDNALSRSELPSQVHIWTRSRCCNWFYWNRRAQPMENRTNAVLLRSIQPRAKRRQAEKTPAQEIW